MRRRSLVGSVALTVLLVACGSSDAVDPEGAAAALDRLLAGWNAEDADAVSAAFADEFYFKGWGPYQSVRTDAASMASYLEALLPYQVRIERTAAVTVDEAGVMTVLAIVTEPRREPRPVLLEIEIESDKVSRLVAMSPEATD